jgi:hypothetical protein
VRYGASVMSKLQLVGIGVLACGAISGFATGGLFGLALASVCLIVGLVMVVASEARGIKQARGQSSASAFGTRLIVAIKDVHARPHQGGKFCVLSDPDQADLEFEVFLKCWLVNETDVPLKISSLQLELKPSDGSTCVAERVSGDLQNWQLGALQEEWDDWEMRLRAAMEPVAELDISGPLECGLPHEGWLHFRLRNVSPSVFRSVPMQISLTDSLSHVHVGTAGGIRHLPGRMWPVLATGAAAGISAHAAAGSGNPSAEVAAG